MSEDLELKQNADLFIKSFAVICISVPLIPRLHENVHNKVLSLRTVFLVSNLRMKVLVADLSSTTREMYARLKRIKGFVFKGNDNATCQILRIQPSAKTRVLF